jgi:beta-N-acetylhexosaminidase
LGKGLTLNRFRPAAVAIVAFVFTLLVIVGLSTIFEFSPLSFNQSTSPSSPTALVVPQATSLTDLPDVTPTPTYTATSTPPPTATFTPTVTPTPTLHPELQKILEEEDFADHIGQLLMIGVSGQEMTSSTCDLIHQIKPGGIILTGSNALNPWQLQTFTSALRDCGQGAGVEGGMLIAIDHEGQFVYRFNTGATLFPMPMALGATGDPQMAYAVAQASGKELLLSGVNTVLGPVGDVISEPQNAVISIRSFGSEPAAVSDFVAAVAKGYMDVGLIPVAKHFPGLGTVAIDPHFELPVDGSTRERIEEVHLQPFKRAIEEDIPIVMVSHADYPALDPSGFPSSMSGLIVDNLLKMEMGFEGIVLTDAIEMGAVVTGAGMMVDDATINAINAGVDMVMVVSPSNASFAYRNLREAFEGGTIPAERVRDALLRILNVKYRYDLNVQPPSPEIDWELNAAYAGEVGVASVTLEMDEDGFVPLPIEWERMLVVCPYWYSSIPTAIQSNGRTVDFVGYSVPLSGPVPEGSTLRALPDRASGYDAVVVCTYDAYLSQIRFEDTAQFEMVQGFLESEVPTIVIALKSPYDLLGFPSVGTYLVTFGTTPGQLSMVADVLFGKEEATGVMPVELGE